MDLFLKIIGGLTLCALLVGVCLLVVFRRWMRKIAKEIAVSGPPPSTIDLTPDGDPAWLKAERVQRDLAALKSCGYEIGSAYNIEGLAGIRLVALDHRATGIYGGYYDRASAGNWVDLCADFADGLELTIGNASQGHQLDTRPDTEKIFLRGQSVAELHAVIAGRVAGRAVKRLPPADFKAHFVATYAKDMAWRNAKQGVSEAEFLRIANDHGKTLSAEQLKEAFRETQLVQIRRWSQEALAEFEKTTTLTVADWKRYENRMIVMRDSFHPGGYFSYLNDILPLDEDDRVKCRAAITGGLNVEGLLGMIASDFGYQFVELGLVERPMRVVVFGVKYPPEKCA